MPSHAAALPRHELMALRHSLAEVGDAKLVRVITMLDDFAAGALADPLIDHIRPRLAKLRPARRLRFARLLFAPLDPLIVPAPQWRAGSPTVPRTALEPLARTVRDAMGLAVNDIDAMIAGRTTRDVAAIAEAGAMLWPHAAGILVDAPTPLGWAEAGLRPAHYPPLANAIGAAMARLPAIQELEQEIESGIEPPTEVIESILDGIAVETPVAQAMTVALLLARLPSAAAVLWRRAETRFGGRPALYQANEQATTALIDNLEAPGATEAQVLGSELGEACAEVRRLGVLIGELQSHATGIERRERLRALRSRLDTACRARFADGLANELLAPLGAHARPEDRTLHVTLETAARRLRALETEGRRIGSGDHYDAMLTQASDAVTAASSGGALSLAHKVRLVEILAGPEVAMSLLESAEA